MASFQRNLGKHVPKYQTIFGVAAAKVTEMAVVTPRLRCAKGQSNHHNTQSFTDQTPILLSNQQCQSTEAI